MSEAGGGGAFGDRLPVLAFYRPGGAAHVAVDHLTGPGLFEVAVSVPGRVLREAFHGSPAPDYGIGAGDRAEALAVAARLEALLRAGAPADPGAADLSGRRVLL